MLLKETPFNDLTAAQRQSELGRILRDPAGRAMVWLIHDGIKARIQEAMGEQKAALIRAGLTEEEATRTVAAAAATLPAYIWRLSKGEIS